MKSILIKYSTSSSVRGYIVPEHIAEKFHRLSIQIGIQLRKDIERWEYEQTLKEIGRAHV